MTGRQLTSSILKVDFIHVKDSVESVKSLYAVGSEQVVGEEEADNGEGLGFFLLGLSTWVIQGSLAQFINSDL